MTRKSVKERFALSLLTAILMASIATFIPGVAGAAGSETVTAPFSNGPNGVTTASTYTGIVSIGVSGSGQASASAYSDAFYVFTDNAGNTITPEHHPDFGLCINKQPVDQYVATIPPYSSTHAYQFTMTVSGSQRLTFGVCDTYTIDNTGSFALTIASAQSQTQATPNANYAGLVASPTATKEFNHVDATWQEPQLTCNGPRGAISEPNNPSSAVWTGLGGVKPGPTPGSTAQLVQIGTTQLCALGYFELHAPFYDFYPAIRNAQYPVSGLTLPQIVAQPQLLFRFPVKARDSMAAKVDYSASNNTYTLVLKNVTRNWTWTVQRRAEGSIKASADPTTRSTAEWIVERPPNTNDGGCTSGALHPLANFHSVLLTGSTAAASQSEAYKIVGTSSESATIRAQTGGTALAEPGFWSEVGSTGKVSVDVQWRALGCNL